MLRKDRVFVVDEFNLRTMVKVINYHQEMLFANGPVGVYVSDEGDLLDNQVYVVFKASDRRYEKIFKNLIKLGYFSIQNRDYYWQRYEAK